MSIYEHFAASTKLPVYVAEVAEFILRKGAVSEIIQKGVDVDPRVLTGGFYMFRDLAPPYEEAPIIARIGYPIKADEAVQRIVKVKEMLHILDPGPARAATKEAVSKLIGDLILEEAREEVGLPAAYDHTQIVRALAILLPEAALDVLRPVYKRGDVTAEEVAGLAKVPLAYAKIALTDEWRKVASTYR